jgi:hypothetical protein
MSNEPGKDAPKRKYKWPWFVLAAFLLGMALAFLWMFAAVQRERSERDFSTPIPTSK